MSAFRRLEPLGFGLTEEDWWIFHPDDCTPDVVWPLEIGLICEESGANGMMSFAQFRTIKASEARGYAGRFGPFMVRADHALVDAGKLLTAAGLYVWLGGEWADAQNRGTWERNIPHRPTALDGRDRVQPRLATAIALRQRYEWAVSLGLEQSPTIRFATDPTGIKEVFRIRDLPEGRDRREALLTWVSDHWRQDRSDPDIEIYVRKHLRGSTSFSWQGMQCELIPSQFDVEQRDRLASTRDALRIAGADRRERPPRPVRGARP